MSNKKKLLRLTESITSRPHLISQTGFNAISHYLDERNLGYTGLGDHRDSEVKYTSPEPKVAGKIGLLEVHGALTYRPYDDGCGAVGTSYTQLLSDATDLIQMGCKVIVMDCDSGGGEGRAAFETGDELRKMCDDASVKLIAYNDGTTASACYALACVADEVISAPDAETGSVGVLIALCNDSKALEMNGYTRTFISAGDSKIPFDADGDWKPEFLTGLQVKVDAMYTQFVRHVSKHTGLSEQDVRDTQAKMFMAEDALKLGLINSIKTRAEFVEYIATQSKES